jgi:succinoglycan biosynthesis protein ExoW
MAAEVAIVMPYFQRQPGILRETVRLVFAQRNCPSFNLIIVDDGSPVPAKAELQELNDDQWACITLIQQANQGITDACNTGLDAVPSSTDWIARLDSDDHWDPDHLARAVMMMRSGFDLFFANEQGGEPVPRLEAVGFWPSEHISCFEGSDLYEMKADGFLEMILKHAQVCSSTVVIRRSKFSSLRYRPTHATCEDMHLFLDIALRSPRVAFSPRVHATHGPGLHVNHVANWKTNRALRTAADFVEYYERILQEVTLLPRQASIIQERYAQAMDDVAAIALGMLAAGTTPDVRLIGGFLRKRPSVLRHVVQVATRRVVRGTADQIGSSVDQLFRRKQA